MKILFSTDSILRGGKERQLFLLSKTLLDKGYEIKILTKTYSCNNYLEEYGLGKSIIKEFNGTNWYTRGRNFMRMVISESPDIMISWDLQTSLFSLGLNKKIKFINASIRHGVRLWKISHFLRSLICYLSPYIIANSYAGLSANNFKPGGRKFVLYNGVEDKFFNTLTKADRENERINLIPGYAETPGKVFITIANLVPYKDYFTVLRALNKHSRNYSFYYFIVGDGPLHNKIIQQIKEFGLEKRVFLKGRIENVRDYLYISDLMIHSSRGEGISNSILEGMYSGLPIIATNVGGIPETVYPPSSMLFNYKDDKVLLEHLINASEAFKTFNPESEEYKRYLNKFSVEQMAKRFEEIIEMVKNEDMTKLK